jgi:serine/alanine adding enzyme
MPEETKFPDIYFLPEWGGLFEEHDHGQAGRFEFRNAKGHVYYQFMKRQLPDVLDCKDYVDIVTPYGFNGPVVIECAATTDRQALVNEFDVAFQQYCLQEHIVSEYVRFSPWLKNHLDFNKIYMTKQRNYTFYTDLLSGDFFNLEFSSKRRNQVRKAQKTGVLCEFDYGGETVSDFIRIYGLTVKKNNVADYYQFQPDFLHKTFSVLKDKQFIINARYKGMTVSSSIFLQHGDFMHYHLCANDPAHYSLCGNSLILYEAAKWGQRNGKKQLHLGGAFTDELFAFKKQFTKNGVCDFFVGKKIRDQKKYDELLELKKSRGGIANMEYFPLYRG